MNYLLMGAGALGSVVGGLLTKSGKSVTFHGRGSHFEHLTNLLPPTAGHWPSMWQDLQAGRRTEIEALNGAMSRYGRELGVPTPGDDVLSRLMRFLEKR
jgi:2-dehydropantoate 2-reductase